VSGGANLGPKYHHCSGWENHHLVGSGGIFAILIAGLYFFKDQLPGNVNGVVQMVVNYFSAFGECFKNLFQGVKEKAGDAPSELVDQGYSNFETAPSGMAEDDDDEEDDIGRNLNQSAETEKLDYDSPEEFGK